MENRRAFNDKILHSARRGLVLAALFIFATTAAATWLAADQAQARPVLGASLAPRDAGQDSVDDKVMGPGRSRGHEFTPSRAPERLAKKSDDADSESDDDNDGKLTKDGKVLTGKLNLNTATEEELQMLPGIGPKKAQRIVEYRTKHGNFKRVRDLRRVKGFGYKTVTKLAPYLSVEGKSTLQAS